MAAMIEVQHTGPVATVALNRPQQHNALHPDMIRELRDAFHNLAQEAEVRVIVLRGHGPSFCAGADITFMRVAADYTFEQNLADGEAIFDLMATINNCPKPVIGRIQGTAIGGGVGLVSCCDTTVAVTQATFGLSEARLGIAPAVISPFVMAKIGPAHARELFMTGERFDAAYAQRIGLIHHLVPDEAALEAKIQERIQQFLLAAPGAQAAIKALVREVAFQPQAAMRAYTARLIAERRASDEGREGLSSFLEKRRPNWQA